MLDHVRNKINGIEGSIRDQTCAINELERDIVQFDNKVKPISKIVCSVATDVPNFDIHNSKEFSVPLFSEIVKAPTSRLKSR